MTMPEQKPGRRMDRQSLTEQLRAAEARKSELTDRVSAHQNRLQFVTEAVVRHRAETGLPRREPLDLTECEVWDWRKT